MRKLKGFTLIELLVVIAVIALLMAILLPALQRVKRQAKAVLCQANLKQWGTILTMYTEDNEGRLPSGDVMWFFRGSYLTDDDDKNKPHPVYHNIRTEGIACCPMAVRTRDKPAVYMGTGAKWRFEGTRGSTFEAWEFTTPPHRFAAAMDSTNRCLPLILLVNLLAIRITLTPYTLRAEPTSPCFSIPNFIMVG